MNNKYEAQQAYWSKFGIPAYNELTVPEELRGRYPYLTYQAVNGSLDGQVTASAALYYRSMSWEGITNKVTEMEPLINDMVPVKGGYIEGADTDAPKQVYEDSLIIFPVGRDKDIKSEDELFNFGLQLIQYDPVQQNEAGEFVGDPTDVECFGQDSFLFKGKDKVAAYYNKDGEKDFEVGNNYVVNDKFAQYFTQLAKDHGKENVGKFTFTEAYMTCEPRTIQGSHVRFLKGELVNYY